MARKSYFPPYSLEEALLIAKTVWEKNAGKPMRRLTLFDTLGRSPSSGTSRQLMTASSGYGLTKGSYAAETISLTERGKAIVEGDLQAKVDAVLGVEVFAAFFENYRNAMLPSEAAAIDFVKQQGVPEKNAQSCYEVLVKSGEQVALIQEISGSKRVVSREHALEALAKPPGALPPSKPPSPKGKKEPPKAPRQEDTDKELPSLNINIQIHISPDASPEQIDQIFASMATHLRKL